VTRRHIHYEAAFEDFLRSRGVPYVAVDESRKAIFAGARIKSFDFIIHRSEGSNWLVDVKGRKFPYVLDGSKRYWENWVTREDLNGLAQWQEVFGEGFRSVLVFAYWLTDEGERLPSTSVHVFRGEGYCFLAIHLESYQAHCRPRSDGWDTVTMPVRQFRQLAQPVLL
jgi:hypothetical protein